MRLGALPTGRVALPRDRAGKHGSSGIIGDCDDGVGAMGAVFRAWGARKHSPPSERGVPPGGRWLMDCECGAEGKGGGGSTAGGRRCRLLHGPSAEGLFLLLAMESRDCHDGRAQYSPRRGPFRFLSSMHGHPIHGRATPLSEGGRSLAPSLILAFAHWIAEEEAIGTHRRSVSGGIGQIGVCFVGRCPRPSLEPIQKQSTPSREGPASSGPCPQGSSGT